MNDWLLALDFGGTKHSAALVSSEAVRINQAVDGLAWAACERVFSPPGADAAYDLRTMLSLAHRLLDGATPQAVGVSFGGPVDATTGTVRLSHHVPGWEATPLQTILEDEFGAPVRVDNDANVAALGEYRFGAGQGLSSLFYITVSTGVGGGWVLEGRPWRGANGMAGEIGHTVVNPIGPRCLCGKLGCVERLASGPYLAQDARNLLEDDAAAGPRLWELVNGDLSAITGQIIAQAAAEGDPLATGLIRRSAWALGMGIGNTANLVNPQAFVLGGGVTKSGPLFWDTLHHVARQIALPEVEFSIFPAALGDDAPLWGAVALAETALAQSPAPSP